MAADDRKTALFKTVPVPRALLTMAVPTIISQLITLVYNMADTWFIGRANNPYMVAASSLVLTVFLMAGALAGMNGIVWTQLTADVLNVGISYLIYAHVIRLIRHTERN